jgi:hypothetical protein
MATTTTRKIHPLQDWRARHELNILLTCLLAITSMALISLMAVTIIYTVNDDKEHADLQTATNYQTHPFIKPDNTEQLRCPPAACPFAYYQADDPR